MNDKQFNLKKIKETITNWNEYSLKSRETVSDLVGVLEVQPESSLKAERIREIAEKLSHESNCMSNLAYDMRIRANDLCQIFHTEDELKEEPW